MLDGPVDHSLQQADRGLEGFQPLVQKTLLLFENNAHPDEGFHGQDGKDHRQNDPKA